MVRTKGERPKVAKKVRFSVRVRTNRMAWTKGVRHPKGPDVNTSQGHPRAGQATRVRMIQVKNRWDPMKAV